MGVNEMRVSVFWVVLLLGLSSLCALLPVAEANGGAHEQVSIQNFAFDPSSLTINVGDSVTWTNNDGASHTASSTSGPESFDSGTLAGSAFFNYTFNTAGTYDYQCNIHTSMTGSITVMAPNNPPEVSGVTLSPSPAFTDNLVSVSATTWDPDGDSVTLSYSWSVNGNTISETGSTLAGSSWFDKGDQIAVELTPNDGTVDGTAASSTSLTISNSPPVVASAAISPSPLDNESIALCIASGWTDADADREGYQYAWEVNGVSLQQTTQSAGPFNADDSVSCTVTPNDGVQSGTSVSSSYVTVVSVDAPDTDGDGVPDSIDTCSNTPQGESVDENGCPASQRDEDGDGVSDAEDVFLNEPSQWGDSDGDGYGDNLSGHQGDACPDLAGSSTMAVFYDDVQDLYSDIPRYGCVDSDGDGYDDSTEYDSDPCSLVGNSTEWIDHDQDCVGDNSDAFPNDPLESQDSDSDGVGDNSDVFIFNPNEWADADGDQVGDNTDECDDDPTGWSDGDLDRVCIPNDVFPNDPHEWSDADGDGTGDNSDLDDDNDGWSDAEENECGSDQYDSDNTPVSHGGNNAGCTDLIVEPEPGEPEGGLPGFTSMLMFTAIAGASILLHRRRILE